MYYVFSLRKGTAMGIVLNFLQKMIFTFAVCALPYAGIRYLIIRKKKIKTDIKSEAVLMLFVLYIFWLCSETIFTGRISVSHMMQRLETFDMMNFTPFVTMARYVDFKNFGLSAVNLLGNVIIFIPLGFFAPYYSKKCKNFFFGVFISFLSSCMIEFIQLFLPRSVDIDDVILNTLGGAVGALVFAIYHFVKRRKTSEKL